MDALAGSRHTLVDARGENSRRERRPAGLGYLDESA
jgi:hypothetical protein